MSIQLFSSSSSELLNEYDSLRHARLACRDEFVQKAALPPPKFLRVIDCRASVKEGAVIIVDWSTDLEGGSAGYTAISHTYGMYVYGVFDCACAAKCFTHVPRADPAKTPCKGHRDDSNPHLQQTVISDILTMCRFLVNGGVFYAWHDGVCIAQHDKDEVRHFIQHMGWIYTYATDTVIFLHYVATPMAPIRPGNVSDDCVSRWQTRVWTFQEAALSRHRQYCVVLGESLQGCCDLLEYERRLALWYEDVSNIGIIEEDELLKLVLDMRDALMDCGLFSSLEGADGIDTSLLEKATAWWKCLTSWIRVLSTACVSFPTIVHALQSCSTRDSKHEGDRINSILALAGVQGFDAPKDEKWEESTIEFFKTMGKKGLALALFTVNMSEPPSKVYTHRHTWVPNLSGSLMVSPSHLQEQGPDFHTDNIDFEVLKDGNIKIKGLLACVAVQFNVVGGAEVSSNPSLLSIGGDQLSVNLRHSSVAFMAASLAGAYGPGVVDLGEAIIPRPAVGESDLTPVMQACSRFEKGVSFCAFLIFPADVLKLDFPDVPFEDPNFPAIIVQGEIKSCVAKIGCFVGSKTLHEILLGQQLHYVTYLSSLIVT